MKTLVPLFVATALFAVGVTMLVGEVTTSAVWAAGVGVTVGVLVLLCAYTVDVIRVRRRHNSTNDGDGT